MTFLREIHCIHRGFLLRFVFLIIFFYSNLNASDCGNLLRDLEIVRFWDEKSLERLPIPYNHLFSTGYFTTPSARMGEAGELGFGGAHVPPYLLWNARFQPFNHWELSLNYRVFKGVEDPGLSPYGFGDFSDRGANLKWALFTPEDFEYQFPGLAFGIEDFMGSKRFTTYYGVATMVLPCMGLEASLGWGTGRYSDGPSRGAFGGFAWFPFWRTSKHYLEGLSLCAEYDPINYKSWDKEPHPDGHETHTPLNVGIKYKYGKSIDLSFSHIRGSEYAFTASVNYNWGKTPGFIPKVLDPAPYASPKDKEPLGCCRLEEILMQDLAFAFQQQGFWLRRGWVEKSLDCNGYPMKNLWISIINLNYRQESVARMRIEHLLAALTPANIDEVHVIIESQGVDCHQYVYPHELLNRYLCHQMGGYEFDLLTPRRNVNYPCFQNSDHFLDRPLPFVHYKISPRTEAFFGSARGKFKYDFGIRAQLEGYFLNDIFYELQVSYTLLSTLKGIADFDFYNPSQLPNVLTDYIRYRQQRIFSTDRAMIQKNWNLGRGWFSRLSGGYFQVNYAGVAGEVLWYDANRNIAIGIEGSLLKKRRYHGLGFQSSLRYLKGYTPFYRHYNVLNQCFLNLYVDFPQYKLATLASVGQFLAHDIGGRLELTRYFESGLRVTGWMTFTNAKDMMHGEQYFNRGIAVELPLDVFFRCSSKRTWNYGMAAWLRDAGAYIETGKPLFNIISRERRF